MKLADIVEKLKLSVEAAAGKLDAEVENGYVSDMLSDVIANSRKGDLWLTLQVHENTVAVATLKELAGIVIIGGKQPADQTREKAEKEGVPLLASDLSAYELAGRLYNLGVGRKG